MAGGHPFDTKGGEVYLKVNGQNNGEVYGKRDLSPNIGGPQRGGGNQRGGQRRDNRGGGQRGGAPRGGGRDDNRRRR